MPQRKFKNEEERKEVKKQRDRENRRRYVNLKDQFHRWRGFMEQEAMINDQFAGLLMDM